MNDGRHQRHAAEQQGCNGRVGCQRQAVHRWREGRRRARGQQRQSRPCRWCRSIRRTQPLQGQGRCDARRLQRRPPPTDHGRRGAQQRETHGADEADLQRRGNAREVAAAQVAGQKTQCGRRQPGAHQQTQGAARRTQHGAFGHHPEQPLAGRQAQHAEQRERGRALRHRQRDHREHQKSADEQCHQCQHRQVYAVGTRQVADARLGLVGRSRAHVSGQLQAGQQRSAVGARHQAQVDAADTADGREMLLRPGDVHHHQRAAWRCHRAGHAQALIARAGLQRQRVAVDQAELFAGGVVGEGGVGVEERQTGFGGRRAGQQ